MCYPHVVRFVYQKTNVMLSDSDPGRSVLQAIAIRLRDDANQQHAEARQDLVLGALATVLVTFDDDISTAWTVRASPEGALLCYDLTPLPGNPIAAELAWRMIDALRQHPQIALAEPFFGRLKDED